MPFVLRDKQTGQFVAASSGYRLVDNTDRAIKFTGELELVPVDDDGRIVKPVVNWVVKHPGSGYYYVGISEAVKWAASANDRNLVCFSTKQAAKRFAARNYIGSVVVGLDEDGRGVGEVEV